MPAERSDFQSVRAPQIVRKSRPDDFLDSSRRPIIDIIAPSDLSVTTPLVIRIANGFVGSAYGVMFQFSIAATLTRPCARRM
jgi:hypothetical protein